MVFGGPVADFTYHRGYTHALFVQSLAAIPLAAALARWYRGTDIALSRWFMAVWLVLVTHAVLDATTIDGTQLGLLFSDYPVGLGSLFIIDPLCTLCLVIGIAGSLLARMPWQRARFWNAAGLALSSLYLVWGIVAQQWVAERAQAALAEQGIAAERMLVTPTPFNTLLWRIVAVGEAAHWEGFYTIGAGRAIGFSRYSHRPQRLEGVADAWPVRRLDAFTKGVYAVNRLDGDVVITDLRMGQAGFYAFAFRVATVRDGRSVAIPVRRYRYPNPQLGKGLAALVNCGLGHASELIACGPDGDAGAGPSIDPGGWP